MPYRYMSIPDTSNPLGMTLGFRIKPGQVVVGNTKEGEKTIIFDAATATNGSYMFYNLSSLTSWNVNMPNLKNGYAMFQSCTGLTSWTVDLPNLTSGTYMFFGCYGLTSWTVDLTNLTNGNFMFNNCLNLTSWTADLPNLTNGNNMFYGCRSLTSCNVELPNLTNGSGMFDGCNLSAKSVKQILNSIPDRASAGLSVAKLTIGKRTNFKTDPDVKEFLGETGAEITAKTYSYKGWDVIVQN